MENKIESDELHKEIINIDRNNIYPKENSDNNEPKKNNQKDKLLRKKIITKKI